MQLMLLIVAAVLTPDSRSDVVLEKVEVRLLEDGSRALRLVGSSAETKGQQSFFFVADPAAGTYRTFVYASQPADNRELMAFMLANSRRLRSEARRTKERGRGRTARRGWENETNLVDEQFCPCDYLCSGYGAVTLTTYDPAFIRLNSTWATASWDRHEGPLGGCVWKFKPHGACWANPQTPQPLNTHWYVRACGQDGPRSGSGYGDFAKWGNYINWDFGLDSVPTGVDQMTRVGVRPGTGVSYEASHYDWGEGEFLIFGSLDLGFENTCF